MRGRKEDQAAKVFVMVRQVLVFLDCASLATSSLTF